MVAQNHFHPVHDGRKEFIGVLPEVGDIQRKAGTDIQWQE